MMIDDAFENEKKTRTITKMMKSMIDLLRTPMFRRMLSSYNPSYGRRLLLVLGAGLCSRSLLQSYVVTTADIAATVTALNLCFFSTPSPVPGTPGQQLYLRYLLNGHSRCKNSS